MTLLANCSSFLEFQLPLPGPQSQHTPSLSTHYAHKTHLWDFPGGPVVETVLLLQRARVRSLVREVRSHTPCGALPLPPKKGSCSHSCAPCLGKRMGPERSQGSPLPDTQAPTTSTWVAACPPAGNGSSRPRPSEGTTSTGSPASSGPSSG